MLILLVGFVFVARRLKVADRRSLGFGLPAGQFAARAGQGHADRRAAHAAGARRDGVARHARAEAGRRARGARPGSARCSIGLASGLVVAFIEETFLRGAMQTAITRESGAALAIALTSLVYAATHFMAASIAWRRRRGCRQRTRHAGRRADRIRGPARHPRLPSCVSPPWACCWAWCGYSPATSPPASACTPAGWPSSTWCARPRCQTSHPPAAWLMSDYDGFIGWMVLAGPLVIGGALYWWYGAGKWIPI